MPTHTQGTVSAFGPPGDGGKGRRSDKNLIASFPNSPLYNDYTVETVTEIGVSAFNGNGGSGDKATGVKDGVVNDSGYMFGTFDLNYADAPNLGDVETGGEGLPASPYVPNLTSPGPGSVSPYTMPEYTGDLPIAGIEFGSGLGALTSPSDTAEAISDQTIGEYISGRSYLGSAGKV